MSGTFNIRDPQSGIAPSSPARRGSTAQVANDVNLGNRTLAPFMDDVLVSNEFECRNARNIVVEDCCVTCVDECDEIVRISLPCVAYYKLVDNTLYASCEPCSDDWCEICIPCDLCAPNVTFTDDTKTDECQHIRSYAYSLVDKFGNTTPMSRPSEPTVLDWDVNAIVSGFDIAHDGCWESICIWATQPEEADPSALVVDKTNFFKVGEIPFDQGAFLHEPIDHPPIVGYDVDKIQRADKPPQGLHCLQVINRGKQLAGLDENGQLQFSSPRMPGVFNEDYMMRFRKPGKAFIATEQWGYVLTGGQPQVIDLQHDCEGGKCHRSTRIEHNLPVISKRSAAAWNGGVVYASDEGLVYLNGTTPTLLTRDHYTRAQWLALQPTLMNGVVHDGFYIGATPTETIRVKLPGNLLDSGEGPQVTTMSIRPTATYASCDGRLYYADAEGVKEFGGGTNKVPYTYQIGPLEVSRGCSMSALKIRMDCCDDVKVRLLQGDCDRREIFCRQVVGGGVIRLPRYVRAEELYIELEGVAEVSGIQIGSDHHQLLGAA